MKRREGAKFIYKLEDGERWAFFNGMLIIVHPERQPRIIDKDGNTIILSTTADPIR